MDAMTSCEDLESTEDKIVQVLLEVDQQPALINQMLQALLFLKMEASIIQTELRAAWESNSKVVHQMARRVREWRKQPLQRLNFLTS